MKKSEILKFEAKTILDRCKTPIAPVRTPESLNKQSQSEYYQNSLMNASLGSLQENQVEEGGHQEIQKGGKSC